MKTNIFLLWLKYKEWINALLPNRVPYSHHWLMSSKLFRTMVLMASGSGGDDNGNDCGVEMRLKTN